MFADLKYVGSSRTLSKQTSQKYLPGDRLQSALSLAFSADGWEGKLSSEARELCMDKS